MLLTDMLLNNLIPSMRDPASNLVEEHGGRCSKDACQTLATLIAQSYMQEGVCKDSCHACRLADQQQTR
jgi:hypothetical protein